jgi:cytochrome b subunit of formate dehydrogenase
MKAKKSEIVLNTLIILIDAIFLCGAFVLQYLSTKKMGVMRYLVFIKNEFESGYFRPQLMRIYTSIIIIGIIACTMIFLYNILKTKNTKIITSSFLAILSNVAGAVLITSKPAHELKAYYFFLIAVFIIIILQYIKLTFLSKGTVTF